MPSKAKKKKTTTASGKSTKEKQACPYCKKQELMFGCPDKNCPNYWKKNLKALNNFIII